MAASRKRTAAILGLSIAGLAAASGAAVSPAAADVCVFIKCGFSVPPNAAACKDGGWQNYTDNNGTLFKNQGDCVSFVATGGKNPANGGEMLR